MITFTSANLAQEAKRPTSSGTMRGETYQYKYTDEDFPAAPSWDPEQTEAPIPQLRALHIGRSDLARFVEKSESWKIFKVELRRAGNDKWFCSISYICSDPICRKLEARQSAILVKMDGTILEPKRIIAVDP